MVGLLMQRPPQVEVWVQMEPAGQGSPPTTQEDKLGGGLVAIVGVRRVRDTRRSGVRSCMVASGKWSTTEEEKEIQRTANLLND